MNNKLIDEMVINQQKLDNCKHHSFIEDPTTYNLVAKRWKCKNCSGKVDTVHKVWYEKGLKHGENIQLLRES